MKFYTSKAASVSSEKGSNLTQHQSNSLKDGDLNSLYGGRIVGGNETTIEVFPWIVSISGSGNHVCGGSIISAERVLTAAHCTVKYPAHLMAIRAGSTLHSSGGYIRNVKRFVRHPNYSNFDHDIAILYLNVTLDTNLPTISIIALPERKISAAVGSKSQVVGWGAICESCDISATLRYVMIPIISNDDCRKAYKGSIRAGMLCAAHPNASKDACQGDSGGPLTYDNVLEGIVSWGSGCARRNYPGVYTRVAYYRDWIDEN